MQKRERTELEYGANPLFFARAYQKIYQSAIGISVAHL